MTDIDLSVLTDPVPTPPDVHPAIQPRVLRADTIAGLPIHSVIEQDPYLNILIYGESGIGKTVLAGSAAAVEEMSPVLFIDVEGGTFSLRERYPSVDVVRVKTWSDMQNIYNAIYDGKTKYKTVVLDSLTEMQKFSMYGIMEELVAAPDTKDRDPDVPGLREWGKNGEQTRKMVRAFRDLPINTIFTALVREDRNTRTGITTTKPGLSGKLSGEVAAFLDEVLYMYVRVVDGAQTRILLTKVTETVIAKDRSDVLPTVITNPTMKTLHDFIFNKDT